MHYTVGGKVGLFLLFYAICLGLGYPTLNRYDPGKIGGTIDTFQYAAMARHQYAQVPPPFRFRVLVPELRRAIRALIPTARWSSWDAGRLAALLQDAAAAAGAALLLAILVGQISGDGATGIIASLLYLCSFCVSNYFLVGLVDGTEAFFILAVLVSVYSQRWWLATSIAIFSTLAKETTPLFAATYMSAVALLQFRSRPRLARLLPVVAVVAFSGALFLIVRLLVGGPANAYDRPGPFGLSEIMRAIVNQAFGALSGVYAFIYLLPLAIPSLRRLPSDFLMGSIAMSMVAFAAGAYGAIGANVLRPLFNTLGPCAATAAAMTVMTWSGRARK